MRTRILCLTLVAALSCVARAQDTCFVSRPIPDSVFTRIEGKSFAKGCTVSRGELRYLSLSYRNGDGETRQGEMVCNRTVAADLVDIFRELWKAGYRIERMRLVDEYDANDQRSMEDNNTSCFNFRYVSGTRTVSKHGLGMAVDVNPLFNPYVFMRNGKRGVEPAEGSPYTDNRDSRTDIPYKIDHNDLCYKLFTQHGFRWGGDWKSNKDYQHFER